MDYFLFGSRDGRAPLRLCACHRLNTVDSTQGWVIPEDLLISPTRDKPHTQVELYHPPSTPACLANLRRLVSRSNLTVLLFYAC